MPPTVGVRDLKNSLSRWLRLVQGGESVIVVDHGRPVAVLSAVAKQGTARSMADHVAGLAARGLLILGRARKRIRPRRPPKVDLSGAVDDGRGERA